MKKWIALILSVVMVLGLTACGSRQSGGGDTSRNETQSNETRDPFVREFEAYIETLQEADVSVEVNVLDGRPHGYGYTENWIPEYADWLENIFANN